tara:strand:+ start:679 stop:960 length:282 start_codon:yes stop_codon:yes gene_type:complete
MEAKLLKKNEWYTIDNGLGPIRAKLLESPKQGRGWKSIVFMDVKGSDAGFFDEAGSVYTKDIIKPLSQLNKLDYNQRQSLLNKWVGKNCGGAF